MYFILSFGIPLGIWFGFRFSQDGMRFFKEMVMTDLFSRSGSASEGHAGNFWFYYETYFKDFEKIYPYLLVTIAVGACFFGVKAVRKKTLSIEKRQEIIGYGLWLLLPFLFFSAVSTKLVWYGYPLFIPLFMAAAIFVGKFLTEELAGDVLWAVLLKTAIAVYFVYLISTSMYDTYLNGVREIHGDELQTFIAESVERDSDYAGRIAYIDAPQEMEDGTIWNQHMRFMAEISGDFRCKDGGAAEFVKDKDAVLYISRERYEEKKDLLQQYKILAEKENYLLLR